MSEQPENTIPEVEEPAAEENKPPFAKTQSALEDLGEEIEKQARLAIGSLVGAQPDDDWDTIGRLFEANFRGFIAGIFKTQPTEGEAEVTWDDIGTTADRQLRKTVGGWAGAAEDDDWQTVGTKMDQKLRAWFGETFGVEKPAEDVAESAEASSEAEGASWDEIGGTVEQNIRKNVGGWVGADADANWDHIGDRFAARFREIFGIVQEAETTPPEETGKTKVPISGDEEEGEGEETAE
ncbi:MAG: hypothetical protein JXB47_05835 [Anaerolineae bacterium]|nr:hypothetical protein [Anaerolineae bacterium]